MAVMATLATVATRIEESNRLLAQILEQQKYQSNVLNQIVLRMQETGKGIS